MHIFTGHDGFIILDHMSFLYAAFRNFPLAYIVLQGSLVYWVTNSLLNIVQVCHCTVFP